MKLAFQVHGERSFPAIMFLHGFLGQASDWLRIVQQLSHDYFCILPDLPGHGKSLVLSEQIPIDLCSTSATLITILDELGIDRAFLSGYSMGGRIALHMAIHTPERIKALLLESANPGIENDSDRKTRVESDDHLADQLVQHGVAPFLEQWYDAPLFRSLHRQPEKLSQLKRSRLIQNPQSLAAALRGLSVGEQQSLWSQLSSIKMPALLVSGALDEQYGRIFDRMAGLLPQSWHVVIADAGHNTHFENPEEFLARLREFLHDNRD